MSFADPGDPAIRHQAWGTALLERHAHLDPALESAGHARRLVRDFLREAGRDEWVDGGELAISEIVTNAALHGHTAIRLRLTVFADRACVEVRDFNSTLPVARNYDRQATTGRGMALVSAITLECGVYSLGDHGKVVWFCVGDPPERSDEELLAAWDVEWDEAAPEDPPGCEVVLLSMPATLWLAARQHHDALLRELVLYLAEHDDVDVDLAAVDKARSTISNALTRALDDARARGLARPALPDGHPSPLPWVPEHLDLSFTVPADSAWQFAAMQDGLDAAEALSTEGKLLLRPGLPEIVAVRDWACEQVIAQSSGIPAARWPGTALERFETDIHDRPADQVDWDTSVVTGSDRGVIAADDANRILAVSAPLAELLGWAPDDLVGRRVVTVVPPALREAHVAGFSRHLTTGEAHVLGVPLELPVLRRDGTEVRCRFLVERPLMRAGRSLYFAWIEPVDAPEGNEPPARLS